MKKKAIVLNLVPVLYLVLLAAVTRWIPHPWNATAIAGLALFSGREITNRAVGYLLPILALLISDMALGFHSTMPFVYIPVLLTVWMGQGLGKGIFKVGLATISSSFIFFVISNLGVWSVGGIYPASLQGLLNCYEMALPFFRNQLLGDLVYSSVIFGLWAVMKKVSVEKPVTL